MKFFNSLLFGALSNFLIGSMAPAAPIKVILFDVFGTCVEVRNSLIRQGMRWSEMHHTPVDWSAFADEWVEHHVKSIEAIRFGRAPWMNTDEIHEVSLRSMLPRYLPHGFQYSSADILTLKLFWHRLEPWGDTRAGLIKLHRKFQLAAFSNGNEELLKDLASFAQMPWDFLYSAEHSRHYKPDKEVYHSASVKLNLPPSQLLLVAAHAYDLRAAKHLGWKTAFISRSETSRGAEELTALGEFDYVAVDFSELADKLL